MLKAINIKWDTDGDMEVLNERLIEGEQYEITLNAEVKE